MVGSMKGVASLQESGFERDGGRGFCHRQYFMVRELTKGLTLAWEATVTVILG